MKRQNFRTTHVLLAGAAVLCPLAGAQTEAVATRLYPNNLVVSRSVYDNKPANVKVGTVLPPNCELITNGCAAATGAPYDGTYPYRFQQRPL